MCYNKLQFYFEVCNVVKIISFFIAICFCVLSFFNIPFTPDDLDPLQKKEIKASDEDIALFQAIYETETKWLASLQLENGAIPMTYSDNGELRVNPYFSDFAALALLDNSKEYAQNVKAYMDWHFAHLNSAEDDFNGLDGTIYDYVITIKDGKIINEKISENEDAYDSTDSYAATFLKVVEKYYNETGDSGYILEHSEDICRITEVMFATLHNGLTYAKPNYEIKYLMDNCEVYEGALAASSLFENVIKDNDYSQRCNKLAQKVKYAINHKMWSFINGYYSPEVSLYGISSTDFSWDNYYPCATSQLFPITCGVIEPNTERAQKLYAEFCNSYDWQSFNYPDSFYWGNNVLAAATMNDIESVTAYMKNYLPLTENHEYPLYNADSARASMAAYMMLQKCAVKS